MHFTYKENLDAVNLCQGDLLKRTPELDAVLREIHPHYFANQKNRFFIVLTQSCDLDIRGGSACRSPYITIAAVRELDFVLQRELRRFQRNPIEQQLNLCDSRYRVEMERFMERLLNNNEGEYFYLRREPAFGLEEDMCALLQLSVPLKSALHYVALRAAKIAQLSESFEHKLAYLLGAIYGRIATDDWFPKYATEEQFQFLKTDPVETLAVWIPSELHSKVMGKLKRLPDVERTTEQVERIASEVRSERDGKLTEVLDEIVGVFTQLGVQPHIVTNARKILKNRPTFAGRIK